MIATIVAAVAVIALAADLVIQRDRSRARARLLLRALESERAQRADASQFKRT